MTLGRGFIRREKRLWWVCVCDLSGLLITHHEEDTARAEPVSGRVTTRHNNPDKLIWSTRAVALAQRSSR